MNIEHRQKISKALKGHKVSEETKEKMNTNEKYVFGMYIAIAIAGILAVMLSDLIFFIPLIVLLVLAIADIIYTFAINPEEHLLVHILRGRK